MESVTPKSPASAIIRVDVGEELRAMRVQGLKHVGAIAELRARIGALEQRWTDSVSRRTITMGVAATAIVTAMGTLIYLLLDHH